MGALRAMETSDFGMIGFGEVYRMYQSGEIEGDDEVALSHADASNNYIGLSIPMVSVRKTLQAARDRGDINEEEYLRVVEAAQEVFFPERTVEAIYQNSDFSSELQSKILASFEQHYVDIKRHDAITLLQHLSQLTEKPAFNQPKLTRSHLFEAMYHRDRLLPTGHGPVRAAHVAHQATLTRADCGTLVEQASNARLVGVLAEALGVEVEAEDIKTETQRLKHRFKLETEEDFTNWKKDNDLDEFEFKGFIKRKAVTRKMQHWLVTRRSLERTTQLVLDELRWSGDYKETKAEAGRIEGIIQSQFPNFQQAPGLDQDFSELLADHISYTGNLLDVDILTWLYERGFKDANDLRYELLRHKLARDSVRAIAEQLKSLFADTAA
jgi:hypothetical protein